MIARKIGYAVAGLVIVSSGAYLFVYLYRWEWNRAMIAGIIFIASELAVGTMMVLERLRRIEERLEEQRSEPRATLEAIRETAPAPASRFKWLSGEEGGLQVFVPVLMGAGVIFSAIAWMVERFARATAKPALEQGLALRLQPLALPEGGFLAPVVAERIVSGGRRLQMKTIFFGFILASGTFVMVDALGDLTQNRPELDIVRNGTGVVTMEITREGWARGDVVAAKSLWHACQQTISPRFESRGFINEGNGVVTMAISPIPGESAARRLRGCLQDATLDNVLAKVLSIGPAR